MQLRARPGTGLPTSPQADSPTSEADAAGADVIAGSGLRLPLVAPVIGAAYLIWCLFVVLNTALHEKGLPSLSSNAPSGRFPLGELGLELSAVMAVAVLAVAVASRIPNLTQWLLGLLTGAWMLSPWLSLGIQEGRWESRFLEMAATALGIALGAALAGATLVRWVLYVAGVIWAGGSLVAGLVATSTSSRVLPMVLATDPADRFTQWVQALGVDVPGGSVRALEGLAVHRNLLGMTLALLLVVQFRHVLTLHTASWIKGVLMILGPWMTGIALVWTLSRTSLAAAAAGVLVSLIPIERVRRRGTLYALGGMMALIAIAPLLASNTLATTLEPGTLRWRAILWQQLLEMPGVWTVLGLGPATKYPLRAFHAHNQALETLIIGGLLGATCLLILTVLSTVTTTRVARVDRRASFACLVTGVWVSQTEIISNSRNMLEMNPANVILIAMVVAAAGLLPARAKEHARSAAAPGDGKQDVGVGSLAQPVE